MQRDLERHGYTVATAAEGATGVAMATAGGFDAICLDHYMPGQDGLDTLEALRTLPGLPPIIYVTGSDEGRIAVAALRAGAVDYVIKEAGGHFLVLLRAAIDGAIERARLRLAHERAEAAVREARDRAEELATQRAMLLREVNHRVANSLQLIASLTRLQEGAVRDPAAREALAAMRNRIAAVAQVHRRLYTSDDVRSVALQDYLGGLLEEIGRSVGGRAIELAAEPMEVLAGPRGLARRHRLRAGHQRAEIRLSRPAGRAHPGPAAAGGWRRGAGGAGRGRRHRGRHRGAGRDRARAADRRGAGGQRRRGGHPGGGAGRDGGVDPFRPGLNRAQFRKIRLNSPQIPSTPANQPIDIRRFRRGNFKFEAPAACKTRAGRPMTIFL